LLPAQAFLTGINKNSHINKTEKYPVLKFRIVDILKLKLKFMNTIKTTVAVLLLTFMILPEVSCKKENTATSVSTQDKILGKWKIQTIIQNDFFSGAPHVTTFTGNASDYADFRSDGKVYLFFQNSYDTSAYGIINDTKMWIDTPSDTNDIKVLTNSAFQIYQKTIFSPSDYTESTVNFSK